MNGQTLANAVVPLPGGALVIYNPSGLAQYNHPDWLGSARLFSSPDRGTAPAMAYAPFGEGYAGGIPWYQFTASGNASTVYDSEGGGGTLHDFQYRHYSPGQGRWISPDPAGLAAVDPTNPQTWNRYAYVANNPLSFVDPTGLDQKGPGGSGCNASVYVCAGGGADGLGGGGLVYVVLGWTELGGSWGTVINFGGRGQTDNGQCNYGLANPCAANNAIISQQPKIVGPQPLKWWEKAGMVLACIAGMDPEFAAPISPGPPQPSDSTDSTNTTEGQGPPLGPNKGGGLVPYGGSPEVPNGAAARWFVVG